MINLSILEFGSVIINFFLTIIIGVSVNNILENKTLITNSSIITTTTTLNPNPYIDNSYNYNMIYLILLCCSLFSDIPFIAIIFMRLRYNIPSQMFIHFFTNVFKFIYWCIFITNNFTCKNEYILQIFILFVAFGTILGAIIDLFFRKINYCTNNNTNENENENFIRENENQINENENFIRENENQINENENERYQRQYQEEYLEGYQNINININDNNNFNDEIKEIKKIEKKHLLKYNLRVQI
jgi:hypothetical protein